jgi:hypothetical protein
VSAPRVVLLAALAMTTIGMMLVIGGILATGLFLPGVVLIGLGIATFAAAAVLHGLARGEERSDVAR